MKNLSSILKVLFILFLISFTTSCKSVKIDKKSETEIVKSDSTSAAKSTVIDKTVTKEEVNKVTQTTEQKTTVTAKDPSKPVTIKDKAGKETHYMNAVIVTENKDVKTDENAKKEINNNISTNSEKKEGVKKEKEAKSDEFHKEKKVDYLRLSLFVFGALVILFFVLKYGKKIIGFFMPVKPF